MTEKDESVKNNTEHTEENENVKNEASSSNDVENNPSEEELNNESTSEHDNDDKNDQSKDEEIQQLQLKANENEEKYLRLFENYKRRIRNENETNKKYQAQPVLTDILPTIDNIERALQIEGNDESFKSLKKGVQMIHESLLRALKDNGLEEIESEGQEFDPNFHQAVVQDDNPDFNSGEITQELQKGYKLKDRVLRPSMVKVNQ